MASAFRQGRAAGLRQGAQLVRKGCRERQLLRDLAGLFERGEDRRPVAAARAGHATARGDMDVDMAPWGPDTRKPVQELLAASRDYGGTADGRWGPASRDAAKAHYLRRN